MVRLFIKEEYMTMQNRMIVKNEAGENIYLIVGKWGRLGDALSLYTLDGERLIEMKQKKLSIFPTFDLWINEEKIASVKKRPGIGGIKQPYFKVTKFNWLITGDFVEQKYIVRHRSEIIMHLEKNISFTGNFYTLRIEKEEVAPLCCILSIVVDHYSPKKGSNWKEYAQKQASLGFLHPLVLAFKKEKEKHRCKD